jgi:hypothetical protein
MLGLHGFTRFSNRLTACGSLIAEKADIVGLSAIIEEGAGCALSGCGVYERTI